MPTTFQLELDQSGVIQSIACQNLDLRDLVAKRIGWYIYDFDLLDWSEGQRAGFRSKLSLGTSLQLRLESVHLSTASGLKVPTTIEMLPRVDCNSKLVGFVFQCRPLHDTQNSSELIELRSLSSSMLDSSLDCIKIIDLEGHLLAMNRPGLCSMEVDNFELIAGKPWYELWPEQNKLKAKSAIDRAREGQESRFQGYCSTFKGQLKWWEVVVTPIVGPSGQPDRILVISRDISEEHQNRLELEEKELRFHLLADNMVPLAWMANPEGEVFWYNQRWYEFTGKNFESMKGWGWQDVHHPDHLERVVAKIARAFELQEDWEDTFPIRRYDGEYRWFLSRMTALRSADGHVLRWLGTNTDITENLLTEAELRRSEQKLALGAEVGGLGLGEIDYQTDLVQLNLTALAIYGLPREPSLVSRKHLHDLFHPDDRDMLQAEIARCLIGKGDETFSCEHRIVLPSGEVRWLSISKRFIFDLSNHSHQPTRSLLAVRDITEQKTLELELRNARRLADAANQAKSDFLANMSHEIRSPMAAILGYAELLEVNSESERVKVNTILRNGQFLLQLLNDILDLSKIEAGKMEIDELTFCPVQLAHEVCSLMNVRAVEQGLKLRLSFSDDMPKSIESDPIRLRQILINLVGNAIKFTEHGEVKLDVAFDASSSQLRFDVIDTGRGIPLEQQRKLFSSFEQGDSSVTREFGGSGLGLAISQRLAKILGGRIKLESKVGQGSRFTLFLDNLKCSTERHSKEHRSAPQQLNSPVSTDLCTEAIKRILAKDLRVLVVDDMRDIRFLTSSFVKQIGGTVVTAANGEEALEMIATDSLGGPDTIDVILMDVQMPKMDGMRTAREMRTRGISVPIIALTANAMDTDREACLKAGYSDYLSKPIQFEKLVQAIDRHCCQDVGPLA